MAKENIKEFRHILSSLPSSYNMAHIVGDLQRLIDSQQIVISNLVAQRQSLISYRNEINRFNQHGPNEKF